jgi:hypothetical protein
MNLVEHLEKAKARLLFSGWAQGMIGQRKHPGSLCASDALTIVAPAMSDERGGQPWQAHEALCNAVGLDKSDPMGSIVVWNDRPERTRAEVLAAFDKAIELARGKQDAGQQQ